MKLISLKTNNFRQFQGEQIFNFSTSENKMLTLIKGESGNGKTTIIHAFEWVLYGNVDSTEGESYPVNQSIKAKLQPGDMTKVTGELVFLYHDTEYDIYRTQCFIKAGSRRKLQNKDLKVTLKTPDGRTEQVSDLKDRPQITINTIVPKSLFPYFFLLGESLDDIGEKRSENGKGSANTFEKAIKGLLGFEEREMAKKHLSRLISYYNDQIAENDKDPERKEILESIHSFKEKQEEINKEIQTRTENNKALQDKIDELEASISRYASAESKQKEAKRCAEDIERDAQKIDLKIDKIFKKFSSQSYKWFLKALADKTESTMQAVKSRNQGIPGMDVKSIQYLLDHKKCICGHELVEGSPEWESLEHWMKFLPPNNIGAEIKFFNNQFKESKDAGNDYYDDFSSDWKELSQLKDELNNSTEQKKALDKEIEHIPEVSDDKQKQSRLIAQREENKSHIARLSEEYAECQSKIDEYTRREKELVVYKNKCDRLTLCRDYCEKMRDSIAHDLNAREDRIKDALQNNINSIFKSFYDSKVNFTLNDNYSISIEDPNGKDVLKDFASGGQKTALALSFIGAIIKVNEKRNQYKMAPSGDDSVEDGETPEVYPLILDAPTSTFDYDQIKSFAKVMPEITNQIVILVNAKETSQIKENMNALIGQEYHIEKQNDYSSVIKHEEA